MFTTSILSTNKPTDKSFSLIESAFKSVFPSTQKDCSLINGTVLSVAGGKSINKKKLKFQKAHLDTCMSDDDSASHKISQLCVDIEYFISNCISHLGNTIFEADSPMLCKRSEMQTPIYDQNGNRRRIRRRPDQLQGEKKHTCPYLSCEKSYTSKCSLYLHIKRNHREFEILKEGEVAPIRINSKVKKGVDIYKVFKKAQAQKYECRVPETDETIAFDDCDIMSTFSDLKFENEEIMNSSMSYCKSNINSTRKTTCNTEVLSRHLSNDNMNAGGLEEIQDFQDIAQNEIFSWSQEKDNRKGSLTSNIIDDPINKFISDQNYEINGIEFNDNLSVSHECYDNDSYSNKVFMSSEDNDWSNEDIYEETYSTKKVDEKLKEFDFLFLSEENDFERNMMFDFEYELAGIQPRKIIVN